MKGPEAYWQEQVVDVAHLYGWRVAHFRTAQQGGRYLTPVGADGKGFPDLVLVRERVIYAELKAAAGALRPDQRVWRQALEDAGCEVYVWKPRDFDVMVATLKRRGSDARDLGIEGKA